MATNPGHFSAMTRVAPREDLRLDLCRESVEFVEEKQVKEAESLVGRYPVVLVF